MPLQTTEDAPYTNPAAAATHDVSSEEPKPGGRLTNADFRKLMMTPRAPPAPVEGGEEGGRAGEREERDGDPKAAERRRRKSYYARMKREDEAKLAELSEKYRDRALERRDGRNPDYVAEEGPTEGQGAYRAVAPDVKGVMDAAERRKQMIQESKFLGGDMEHTHLVKGLDYALLQKVRSEIVMKEQTDETEDKEEKGSGDEAPPVVEAKKMGFKTSMGRRIYQTIARSGPEFNDLFLPGRMAYSIDLEADDEIPTTVIRSKADLQGIENMQATFTSNDLVIQKLSQILSYLRTGKTSKKFRKKDVAAKKGGEGGTGAKAGDDSIYGDIGNYVPGGYDGKGGDRDTLRNKERRGDRYDGGKESSSKGRSYFDSGRDEDRDNRGRRGEEASRRADWRELDEGAGRMPAALPMSVQPQPPPVEVATKRKMKEDTYYTECYPDMAEMHDAIEDSDEEADYTKMDLGNRKGPIGRWDFDNTEDYSNYMNQKEALPKAAFQYGVKMADGRKTRRIPGNKEKDRNAELNREWQQISAIIKKKKDDGPAEKRPRY